MCHGTQEESDYSSSIPVQADFQKRFGGHQAQVHRYLFEVRTWSLPDNIGEGQGLRKSEAHRLSGIWKVSYRRSLLDEAEGLHHVQIMGRWHVPFLALEAMRLRC